MGYVISVLIGYLLGCKSMAMKVSKRRDTDVRESGSGNLGASNVVLLLGWKAGVATGLHDIGKAFLAVFLAKWMFPKLAYAGVAAGVSAIFGHMFPAHLGFRGGKGFACYYGMLLGLNWRFALVMLAIIVVVVLVSDYIVMGTVSIMLLSPAYMGLVEHNAVAASLMMLASGVMLVKHRSNFERIRSGQEARVWATLRGEYKEFQLK